MLETLTTKDIAKDLKVSRRTVQKMITHRGLPALSTTCREVTNTYISLHRFYSQSMIKQI